MARKYLFVCNVCGAAEQTDSERLPDGWAVIVATGVGSLPIPSTQHLDTCSRECAVDALFHSPRLAMVASVRGRQLDPAQQPALSDGGDS
jgi:hypothetical protein